MPRLTELSSFTGPAPTLKLRSPERKRDARALAPHVFRLTKDVALVETLDVLAPVVDDAKAFGRIAAAHALAKLWASGAKALFARHVVSWPSSSTEIEPVLRGAEELLSEIGVSVTGTHASQSKEARYGLALTGTVAPKNFLQPVGARNGDLLFLTKPLGSGIAAAAIARGKAPSALAKNAIGMMTETVQDAAVIIGGGRFKVSALAAVGKRGLLGQLYRMLGKKDSQARLYLERIPIMEGVPQLAASKVVPEAAKTNLELLGNRVVFPDGLPDDIKWVLSDAQVNGGLLVSIPWQDAKKAMAALNRRGVGAAPIGEVTKGEPGIYVDA